MDFKFKKKDFKGALIGIIIAALVLAMFQIPVFAEVKDDVVNFLGSVSGDISGDVSGDVSGDISGDIPKHIHSLSKTEANNATCTDAGNSAYYFCSGCGKYFSDENAANEIEEDSWIIPAKGHNYTDVTPTWKWYESNKYACAYFKCADCGKTECSEKVTTTPLVTKAATCTKAGATTYYAKVVFNGKKYSGEITDKTIPAAPGHKYVTTTTKATLSKAGSKVTKCKTCGAVKSTVTIARIKTVKLSATSNVYNGKVQKPSVTVTDTKGKKLTLNTDYTVTYSGTCKYVGTYNVTVSFKGNYSGTKTLSYKITKANPKFSFDSIAFTCKYKTVKKKNLTLSMGASVSSKGTLKYSISKYSSNAKSYLTINKTSGIITVKKGTPKGTYKIKVIVSARATKNFNSAYTSKIITVVVK